VEIPGKCSLTDLQVDESVAHFCHLLFGQIKFIQIEAPVDLNSLKLDFIFFILKLIVYRPEFLSFQGSEIETLCKEGNFVSIQPFPVWILSKYTRGEDCCQYH
jgi:hypothetical protein